MASIAAAVPGPPPTRPWIIGPNDLFNRIPAEIRNKIYYLTLKDESDVYLHYNNNGARRGWTRVDSPQADEDFTARDYKCNKGLVGPRAFRSVQRKYTAGAANANLKRFPECLPEGIEMRNAEYQEPPTTRPRSNRLWSPLLAVCRYINHEASQILYDNTIIVDSAITAEQFLGIIGPEKRQWIHKFGVMSFTDVIDGNLSYGPEFWDPTIMTEASFLLGDCKNLQQLYITGSFSWNMPEFAAQGIWKRMWPWFAVRARDKDNLIAGKAILHLINTARWYSDHDATSHGIGPSYAEWILRLDQWVDRYCRNLVLLDDGSYAQGKDF